MRCVTGLRYFFLAGLLAVCLAVREKSDDPAPKQAASGQHLPKQCAGFVKSGRTRLAAVYGSYEPITMITATAFSSDRSLALVASMRERRIDSIDEDDDSSQPIGYEVTLWDTAKDQPIRILAWGKECPSALAIFRDGKLGLTGTSSGVLQLWDLATGKQLQQSGEFGRAPSCLALSADGKRVLAGMGEGSVWCWTTENGNDYEVVEGRRHGMALVAFLSDGKQELLAGNDGQVRIWSMKTGKEIRGFEAGLTSAACVALDNKRVFLGTQEGPIQLLGPADRQANPPLPRPRRQCGVS
jgi:WD40 repeat protein